MKIQYGTDITTGLDVFTVTQESQNDAVAALSSYAETTLRKSGGFVGAIVNRSLDGVRVALYSQWRSLADRRACQESGSTRALYERLSDHGPIESNTYELAIIDNRQHGSMSVVEPTHLPHINVFSLAPENQQKMLELASARKNAAMQNPGLIAVNFHRSLDGTRVANYGLWRSLEEFEVLRNVPGFGDGNKYWEGLATNDLHLYEIATMVEASTCGDG